MTHSLHRQGTVQNLSNDYVLFAMSAKDINEEGAAAKLQEFLRIVLRHKPVNIGDMKTGNGRAFSVEEIMTGVKDTSVVHAVFTDTATLAQTLREVQEADLGMSVVISGLLEPMKECCQRVGLGPHTVEYSLGVWGLRDKLPSPAVLEVTTMCGHGMVAFGLVEAMVEDIRAGKATPEGAAEELTKTCVCGIFNPVRASQLLAKMAQG